LQSTEKLCVDKITFISVATDDLASTTDNGYNAKDLAVLEGLDAVRKRPGMYIGTTDSRGLMHCLWEIIDNSVENLVAGPMQLLADCTE
jgi:DNA gyrase subunit B